MTLKLLDIQDWRNTIEVKHRTSADLLKNVYDEEIEQKDPDDFISTTRFEGMIIDFIGSSMRLSDIMDTIWHGSSLKRGEILIKSLEIIPKNIYKYIIIDIIPCYELKYSLISLVASDICIVPVRPTNDDLGRTIIMMQELRKKSGMDEKNFQKKIYFLLNMIQKQSHKEKFRRDFRNILLKKFPNANFFNKYIENHIHFTRVGTKSERGDDLSKVRNFFKPFYEEFKERFS